MLYVILALAAAVVVGALLLAKRNGKAAEQPTSDAATSSSAAEPSSPPSSPAPAFGDIDGRTAPAAELSNITCTYGNCIYGMMPPFGQIHAEGSRLVFTSTSRVTSASSSGIDSSETASTMQSVGSFEIGQFHFELNRGDILSVQIDGSRATIDTPAGPYSFEGVGTSARQLIPWLRDHGVQS